ncbi:GntR family transcriptional regulator [Streptomyces sp. NBRC 109706]|uniref:GntR family transcriptional regulator n=1 Tax=Streptomyces sp. NBRC 109706 TaxID=1550035 RepID=UPI000780EFFF|nr:GntR family transcriptional regulator [Streptomyces sp. NBRC 109706]
MTKKQWDRRPAAERIAASIRTMIMRGEEGWEPAAQLPTTADLMAEHGVSNVTIQRAVGVLKSEGLLVGRSGSGVYVRDEAPHVITPASYISPEPDSAADRWKISASHRGRETNRVLAAGEIVAPKRVAEALGEETVIRRKRLGLLDGEPAEVTYSYYPASWARGTELAQRRKIRGGSPRVLAELGHRLAPPQVDEVSARWATPEEYELLQLPGDVPVFDVFRMVPDSEGVAVEVTELIKPGHIFKLGYRVS